MKFNSLIPELSVSDFNRSMDFYKGLLGFKVEYEGEESKVAFLSLGESPDHDTRKKWRLGNSRFKLSFW